MKRSVALGIFVIALLWHGLIIRNVTPSEPEGRYLLLPAWHLQYGDLVIACEPASATRFAERHHFAAIASTWPIYGCPNDRLIFKNVWGLPGDRMTVRADGVRRNGILLSSSMPAHRLHDGTPLPIVREAVVPKGMIWGGSTYLKSYDSRYFGPIHPIARVLRI